MKVRMHASTYTEVVLREVDFVTYPLDTVAKLLKVEAARLILVQESVDVRDLGLQCIFILERQQCLRQRVERTSQLPLVSLQHLLPLALLLLTPHVRDELVCVCACVRQWGGQG